MIRRLLIVLTAVTMLSIWLGAAPADTEVAHATIHSYLYQDRGFDACDTPTSGQLDTWWLTSPYYFVGVYLGGTTYANQGCSNSNLTSSWVSHNTSTGWGVLLIWDGKQASCNTDSNATKMSSDPSTAYSQGESAASSATSAAEAVGIGTDVPIFYDLEAFDYSNSGCLSAAESYIDGWDDGLLPTPFALGLYGSSCASDLTDFAGISDAPSDAFIAEYNNEYDVDDVSCVPNSDWNTDQRVHQFLGAVDRTWNGLKLNVDLDCAKTYLAGVGPKGSTCDY